jgi:uncharacterized protein (DUF4415 family)
MMKMMKREYDFSKARRGALVRPRKDTTLVTIRLEDEILKWFRRRVEVAGGGNYQAMINDALRQHIEQLPTSLRA